MFRLVWKARCWHMWRWIEVWKFTQYAYFRKAEVYYKPCGRCAS